MAKPFRISAHLHEHGPHDQVAIGVDDDPVPGALVHADELPSAHHSVLRSASLRNAMHRCGFDLF